MKTHYPLQQWMAYAAGSRVDRVSMEAHLAFCEQCREVYVKAIEAQGDRLPVLADVGAFADEVGKRLKAGSVNGPKSSVRTARPIVQYVIAASLTVVLVGSGAFQQLLETFSDLSRQAENREKAAITAQLADKAGRWLDAIPVKQVIKEEGRP